MWNRMILTICSVFVLTSLALAGDMTHVPDRDFDTLKAAGNRSPTGIWSNGTTLWVADYGGHIYAYGGLGATSDQDIQDFSMKIRGSTGSLKVCVRDHECEEGLRKGINHRLETQAPKYSPKAMLLPNWSRRI